MATSSVSGTGTGTGGAYASLIESLLTIERQPINDLVQKQSQLSVTQGILSDLGTKLSDLRANLDALRGTGGLSPLSAFSVTSSNTQTLDATAAGSAARGNHRITISQLAQAHTLGSAGFVKTGAGFAAGSYTFAISTGGTSTNVSVTVADGDTNATVLSNIAQAVNASGAKVNASVVTTDAATGTQKLVLQSANTGTASLISDVEDTQGGLAAQLGINGASSATTWSASTLQQAADAKFNLDGVDLVAGSNQVSDVLTGVTLNLKAESATAVSLNISADTTQARKAVDDFITRYNTVVSYLKAKSAVSEDGKTREALAGNFTFSSFVDGLRGISAEPVDGSAAGAPSRLSDLGITANRDGTLTVSDGSQLTAALNANPAQVVAVFAGAQGVAGKLYALVDGFDGSGGGLSQEAKALTDQSTALGSRKTMLEDRLERRRAQLVAQFARLQDLATMINQQQQQLSGLLSGG